MFICWASIMNNKCLCASTSPSVEHPYWHIIQSTVSMCISKFICWASIVDIIQVPQQVNLPWYPSGCSCSHASASPSLLHPCDHEYSGILMKHVTPLFPYCDWSICAYKLYALSIKCSPSCTFIYEVSTCMHLYISFPFIHIHIWSFHLCMYMYEVSICVHISVTAIGIGIWNLLSGLCEV